mgnify:CR=1 FL=1
MATGKELSDFLASIEKRAFKQAAYAVRRDETALDIVQDAMIKLAEKYGDRPASELPMLFQRILQNTISDFFRREKVRNTWVSLFSSMSGKGDDDDFDWLEVYQGDDGHEVVESSADKLERAQVLTIIEEEIEKLPARQREAFLMRYWNDMDVAETAEAMNCSENSFEKNTGPYMTQESAPPTLTPVSSPFLLVSRHHSEVSPFINTEEYQAPHS